MGRRLKMTLAAILIGGLPATAGAQQLVANTLPAVDIQPNTVQASAVPNTPPVLVAQSPAPVTAPAAPPAAPNCDGVSPYQNYACLDAYLGDGFWERLYNYYKLEWGQAGPPTDPNAPPGRRSYWPATPETTPPISFTEWPHGAVTPIGVTTTASTDSPLMTALSNTGFGQWLNNYGFQIYGWVDPGINLSSNHQQPGGNSPISYIYTPNQIQLDQAVIYLDRFPDTVQTDHIDWGLRLSAIYGENYRYTTAYGIASWQLLEKNNINGYDFPMMYGELYFPQVAYGMDLRLGRYISIPDIEAQLAPNNYMYTHSITYAFDNYTNEGLVASVAVMPNILVQAGVVMGTESAVWHYGQTIPNPFPNPLFPGTTMPKDPGAQFSGLGCVRFNWNNGNDTLYPCVDGLNSGTWGYNNLQWHGFTYYHKFNDQWHISYEFYDEWENKVPNILNPQVQTIVANGGEPFASFKFNAPNMAQCHSPSQLDCRAQAIGTVSYINYTPDPLNNFSLRPEFYDDMEGQRTGTKARYVGLGLGWQHWLSPQIEFRPEVDYYYSIGAKAFNGNSNAGVAPDKNHTILGAMDMIFHF
jgi:hypothetical protein